MLSLHKINPMVRAVGTMGAVAALVTGVTFANLTSNTVALTNNTLSTATASLVIGSTSDCTDVSTTSVPGMSFTNLIPGQTSAPFTFCLGNTGTIPLNVTAQIPQDLSSSSLDPSKVTLNITCGGGTITKTLADLHTSAWAFPSNPLSASGTWSCTATATLDSSVTGGSVNPFTINFVGTQV